MFIDLIGVPLDLGAGRRGVDMGASAIRYAGVRRQLELLGHTVMDRGNVHVALAETVDVGDVRLRYFEPIVQMLITLMHTVKDARDAGRMPVILGGDHSLALGSIAGAAHDREIGVIWIDAHGDFNTTQTSPSGNIHGMPLAALCGIGDERLVTLKGQRLPNSMIKPEHIALVGIRDLDHDERLLMMEQGLSVFATEYIDRYGMNEAMQQAIKVASQARDGFYVSFDLDVLDPAFAPGVGTPMPGGITYREAHLAAELLAESGRMIGLDVVEV
ncbi:MAG: arginase, partial [Herpetosiphon sp.]|nr:arginase [Herpetosiphon sp.]